MKKLVTIVLAGLLISAMSITAFAANPIESVTSPNNSAGLDVKGVYGTGGVNAAVYSVEIAWGSMEFTYNGGTWNAGTHVYDNTEWRWKNNGVTVTNHSNRMVYSNVTFSVAEEFDGKIVPEILDPDTVLQPAAIGTTTPPYYTAYLELSGNLGNTSLAAAGTKLGTITVTISEFTP